MESNQPATKFTSGPWTAEDESLNAIIIRAPSKSAHKLGQEIASVMNEEGSDLTPTMWANARLIAAATIMFWAMVGAQTELEYWHSKYPNENGTANLDALTNAITLAGGKS